MLKNIVTLTLSLRNATTDFETKNVLFCPISCACGLGQLLYIFCVIVKNTAIPEKRFRVIVKNTSIPEKRLFSKKIHRYKKSYQNVVESVEPLSRTSGPWLWG